MKHSKDFFGLLFLASVVLIHFISCEKDDDNPDPAEKSKNAWVVGQEDSTGYGMILFTPDAGETWQRQAGQSDLLQSVLLNDVWAIDEDIALACGSDNSILRTTDGGQNWLKLELPADNPAAVLNCIHVYNGNYIFVCGTGANATGGIIYSSPDRGDNWTLLDTSLFTNTYLQGIWALSPDEIYTVGALHTSGQDRGFIAHSLDGGQSWDSLAPADDYNKWEWIGVLAEENTIVIHGAKAHYILSTDGGQSWSNELVPGTGGQDGADINDLIMLDTQTWWGAFDMGQIFITTDGGNSWALQETPGLGGTFLVGIDAWDNQIALAVPFSNYFPAVCPVIQTTDGGNTWNQKYVCRSNLWKVSFVKD